MERSLSPMTIDQINSAEPVEIEIESDEPVEVEIEVEDSKFEENLAETISPSELQSIASDLIDEIRIHKNSRHDWEKTVTDGLAFLGMTIEERTEPWSGACGVYHSIMSEAVIKFQSEMIMETFPATGPVQTKVLGKITKEKEEAAARVKDDMNWQLLDNMVEYRSEHERMLWNLGFTGSAFKKVYFDPALGRQTSMFVPAEDVYLPYGTTDLSNCHCITQLMRKTENEIRQLMESGFYVNHDVLGETARMYDDLDKKKQKLAGMNDLEDNRYVLFECHTELNLPGDEGDIKLPYVVTLDTTGKIYAIYRNWDEDDELHLKRDYYVQYNFIPGIGPYGFGYVHILGGYAKGATSILRQLVDAGTLSNLPGGLKARGLRIKGDDTPIAPGEFRDVDVPAGTIRDNIMNLPYKEPSATLFSLFKEIVEEGRMLASTADMQVADMNQQAPVGTTLAIIERMMKVMSAVQARAHASMKKEFRLLKNIIRDNTAEEYDYDTDAGRMIKQSDYDQCDIIPVSDPNASSSTMRMAQYQAALQLADKAPQLYDLPSLHREALLTLGMKNAAKIVPDKDDLKPKDPISENMALMNGKPIKAFQYQDHDAHIAVHMAAAQDPSIQKIIGQNPQAQLIQQALQAHLMEHMAFKYRLDIEKQMGVTLPPMEGEEMPKEVEIGISRLAAEAAPQVLAMHSQKAAQEMAQQQAQDPMLQLQQQELQLKQQELAQKDQNEKAKIAARAAESDAKIASAEKIAELKASESLLKSMADVRHKDEATSAGIMADMAKSGMQSRMPRGSK